MAKRLTFVAALCAVLAGCGGGSSSGPSYKNPDDYNFSFNSYGSPTAQQDDVASLGEDASGTADGLLSGAMDADRVQDVATLPDEVGSAVFYNISYNSARAGKALALAQASVNRRAAAYLLHRDAAVKADLDDPSCVVVSASSVTFNNCTETETDTSSSGTVTITYRINGTFNRADGRVYWDASFSLDAEVVITGEGSGTVSASERYSGDITFGASTIQGYARADAAYSASSGGEHMSFALTNNVDLDMTYDLACPSGIVGGTLTAKQIWAERPSGYDASNFPDAALQIHWLGCGSVEASWGTL